MSKIWSQFYRNKMLIWSITCHGVNITNMKSIYSSITKIVWKKKLNIWVKPNCQRICVPPNRSSNGNFVINIVIISIPVGTNGMSPLEQVFYTIYSVRNIYCNIYSCGNNIPEYFILLELILWRNFYSVTRHTCDSELEQNSNLICNVWW